MAGGGGGGDWGGGGGGESGNTKVTERQSHTDRRLRETESESDRQTKKRRGGDVQI